MSFDGFFMHHMNEELKQTLLGGRINKIYQPSDYEIVFFMRANRQNHKLLFSIHPMQARYHVTDETFFNPEIAPNFCMVLRKYLEGAILTDIQQVGLDRITTFLFKKHDDLGDQYQYHLTIELMGRHSNIFLIQPHTNTILDCLKHVSSQKNSVRSLRPNQPYQLPPYQNKLNILTLSSQDILQLSAQLSAETSPLSQRLQGIGKVTLQWIQGKQADGFSLAESLQDLQKVEPTPMLIGRDFSALPFQEGIQYPSFSQLLDVFYVEKAKLERLQQLSGNLLAQLKQFVTKLERKLEKLDNDKIAAENCEEWRIKGELLTAYSFQIEKGTTHVTLPNFYDNDAPMEIALDPQKNATQNAQHFFRQYQKLKQSLQFIEEQTRLTKQELSYLESVLVQINLATTEDLVAIKEELIATGYLKDKQKMKRKNKPATLSPLHFKASDGTLILVGRNNLQNDQLTLKSSKKEHIWLHAKDIPGSHVVIQSDNPSDETIVEAAKIAAYYSKYQKAGNVPVDYVAIKHIKKPNGTKPGYVIYEQQKTVYVSPTDEHIQKHRLT